MKILFIIPARGGSKGIPGKNIKPLNGKPLLHYSLQYARQFAGDEDICLSTDDKNIAECAGLIGYEIPFMRPKELATDTVGSYGVLQHALGFYQDRGNNYDAVVLLQPTSPFRERRHLEEALGLFHYELDMVVSVTESALNPYYNLFEEQENGLLRIAKGTGDYVRRQDVPAVYAYNGAIYVINADSLRAKASLSAFSAIRKYVMDQRYAVDLDVPADWAYAEFLSKSNHNENS
ncbi:acylneuraminate cytidylyltransferase family protein [Taibaiella koreensis]|uniref:acylneuraminate cytidylyltransferase family protein n=1 Tax=Taibaiella koreensis TaxID=1268548 RepID=UPI000E59EEB8|nr:acylneuraminate cytidylyltransferase family protein [Taibaiella koreensis]